MSCDVILCVSPNQSEDDTTKLKINVWKERKQQQKQQQQKQQFLGSEGGNADTMKRWRENLCKREDFSPLQVGEAVFVCTSRARRHTRYLEGT